MTHSKEQKVEINNSLTIKLLEFLLIACSVFVFTYYQNNNLGLAYNDARSHLDIGRRVVEGLTPGFTQLGSVWLPLPHLLMLPTIWNSWMWHSGLAGALPSMAAYVWIGLIIYRFLERLSIGLAGRIFGVLVFALNPNVLYLQSTAMTEILFLATMITAVYQLLLWQQGNNVSHLILSAFWVMLSTLTRYDGWFLYGSMLLLIFIQIAVQRGGYKSMEGKIILFITLGGLGILLWLGYNQLIFGSAFYFINGPYSAGAQQAQIAASGELATKHNLFLSLKYYGMAVLLNNGFIPLILGTLGGIALFINKKLIVGVRLATLALLAPVVFNILSLYIGQSVIFIPALDHHTWFNIRYGILVTPCLAIFAGYIIGKLPAPTGIKFGFAGITITAITYIAVITPIVTLADAKTGASQKNVSEVSAYLHTYAADQAGFVMISSASNDAIIFSSGLPMSRFITEGNGRYWSEASEHPELWARWIVMRTNDTTDGAFHAVKDKAGLAEYTLVEHFPFADVYQLQPQYRSHLITTSLYSI